MSVTFPVPAGKHKCFVRGSGTCRKASWRALWQTDNMKSPTLPMELKHRYLLVTS